MNNQIDYLQQLYYEKSCSIYSRFVLDRQPEFSLLVTNVT